MLRRGRETCALLCALEARVKMGWLGNTTESANAAAESKFQRKRSGEPAENDLALAPGPGLVDHPRSFTSITF